MLRGVFGRHFHCGAAHGLQRLLSTSSDASQAVECVVIGAGVVGLACARALAMAGREVVIVDSANSWGTETSARHSEVIHAGLYYPTDSLKAKLCVQGNRMLYEYCQERNIPHRRVTKLVVATTDSEVPALRAVMQRAKANGVTNLHWLSGQEAQHMEPELRAAAAFLSANTGILDSHTYMSALLADAEQHGASLSVASRVVGGRVLRPDTGHDSRGIILQVEDQQTKEVVQVHAQRVVNAAGLWAQSVSRSIEGVPHQSVPQQYLARGVYFTLDPQYNSQPIPGQRQQEAARAEAQGAGDSVSGCSVDELEQLHSTQPFPKSVRSPFRRLIYPMPQDGGLGIHLTLDMQGNVRFGPDVEWVDKVDYRVDPKRGESFYKAIRTYWPGLPDHCLQPGYSGVRPKLSGPGQPAADFVIQTDACPGGHGVPGLVCLYGIESPGLTSSLAIAEHVKTALLGDKY